MNEGFKQDLAGVINSHSMENGSDTPDFVLGEFLVDVLSAFDKASATRKKWNTSSSEIKQVITGFAAWLTTRDEAIVLGAKYNSYSAISAVEEYCKLNGIE